MWKKTAIVLMSASLVASGCSSISFPSMPWSGSATKADPTAEALFDEGVRNMNEKRYIRAIDNFTKIKTDYPFSPLVTQAELQCADAYYLNEQFPEAVNLFKEFQSLHPTSEHNAFVTLRLGQAYFDQFTGVDRDQKNTELAKGYFETVITSYPKSPQAAIAREKLAQAVDYLAEHDFTAAQFYFKEQKYAAARDRFEEIVRKYRDTPTAVKSLFFLGESYRLEKNGLRATLAYEALIQRYPQSKYAADARIQLALVEKEKRDPLDLLLMRDRRPGAAPAPEIKEDPALAKLKDLNLVAKKEVVFEEPGAEKGFLQRIGEKINPFSSSSKSNEPPPPSALDLIAKKNEAAKQDSGGFFSSLWPFGSSESSKPAPSNTTNTSGLVAGIDQSLNQKGIDSQSRQASLKAPAADLPKPEPVVVRAPTDTGVLLGSIDANLQKSGTNPSQMPQTPAAAAGFNDLSIVQAAVAANDKKPSPPTSEILSSIDQKLRAQGVEPAKFEPPPPAQAKEVSAPKPQPKTVELNTKLTVEKGPLFLSPGDTPVSATEAQTPNNLPPASEPKVEIASRPLVKGPIQTQAAAPNARAAAPKTTFSTGGEDATPNVFGQMQQDIEKASKILNPFSW